jgi:hypothetical protein
MAGPFRRFAPAFAFAAFAAPTAPAADSGKPPLPASALFHRAIGTADERR